MNKKELIKKLVNDDMDFSESEKLVSKVFSLIEEELIKGNNVIVTGFGTFRVFERKERQGLKPKTGEVITIAPRRVVTFKPSPLLKKKMNSLDNSK